MRNTPKVGQILYQLRARRVLEHGLKPVTVTQVGRKYFKVSPDGQKGWQETQYHLDTWYEVTEYVPETCLYETAQEYCDETEKTKLVEFFRRFDEKAQKLSLETLRKIQELVFVETGKPNKEN